MIIAFQQLYKGRIALDKIQTDDEIRQVISSELKDEFTHPRARLSVVKKYQLAIQRIQASNLNNEDKKALLSIYKEEYLKVSTGNDV
ncbi:hypothetical protein WAX74_00980 [Psychrobacillus sp. FJAT-51614]|uniref:Uncharacterized protein n=1 Tax=Psychrobacillus mangrovi TaxID=3117745 RepID=A0ABU8EZW3_9BACI